MNLEEILPKDFALSCTHPHDQKMGALNVSVGLGTHETQVQVQEYKSHRHILEGVESALDSHHNLQIIR